MADQRTLRSKVARAMLWYKCKGICQICGERLDHTWHADHVIPYSLTKTTNVHQMQALCARCNLQKSDKIMHTQTTTARKDRKHQREFGEMLDGYLPSRNKNLLIAVMPGGGKSSLPIKAFERYPDHKVLVLCPRLNLTKQGALGLMEMGYDIRESGNEADPSRGSKGVITTHQSFGRAPDLWKAELKAHKYIVFVDECQHAKVYQDGSKNELAKALDKMPPVTKVLMSGTLETNDGSYIYGLNYKEDEAKGGEVVDFDSMDGLYVRYKRADAHADDAIVETVFLFADAEVKFKKSDKVTSVKLSKASKEDESAALSTALSTSYRDNLLKKGIDHWSDYKKKHGGYGRCLIVCSSQADARDVASMLRHMKVNADIAISDESKAAQRAIDIFKDDYGHDVLVTVGMAYEGLDCPSITHLVCLTNIRSCPWIEQMLGRAWRRDYNNNAKTKCFAFVPEDPKMMEIVERIRKEDAAAIRKKKDGSGGGGGESSLVHLGSSGETHRWESLDGSAVGDQVDIGAANETLLAQLKASGVSAETLENARREMMKPKGPVVDVFSDLDALAAPAIPKRIKTLKDQEKELRSELRRLCNKANFREYEVADGTVQKEVVKHFNQSATKMDIATLKRAISYVEGVYDVE